MSSTAGSSQIRLAGELAALLSQVVESMTGQKPDSSWEEAEALPGELQNESSEPLWWEQRFQILPQPVIWLGATRPVWEEIGAETLRAAGIETVETADARSTWLEIVGQALGGVARTAGSMLGREVTCAQGGEASAPQAIDHWFRLDLKLAGTTHSVWAAISRELTETLDNAEADATTAIEPAPARDPYRELPQGGRTMDLLLNVELPVSISFGRTQIPLRDVLKLTTGSIVELNRGVGEPVEVLVNHSLIARGEVVVIDGNYGVRIQEIVRSEDRLRSLR